MRSRVAFARRGLAGVRLIESVLLGLTGFAVALAAVVQSGGSLETSAAWLVAALCGALSGLTWTCAHRRSPREVARAIDSRLGEGGALFTAWELEARPALGELGALLGREVAGRRTARAMLQAIMPATASVLALPFLAAVLLFLALEGARSDSAQQDLALLSSKLSEQLSGLSGIASESIASESIASENTASENIASESIAQSHAKDLSQSELAALSQLARDASRSEDAIRRGEVDASEELGRLQERLEQLEASTPRTAGLREAFDRAAATLDSALMALDQDRAAASDLEGGADGTSQGSTPGREVAPGSDDGTMARFQSSAEPDQGTPSELPRTNPAGVLGGPSWPAAFDGIVARWVEAQRAAR